MTRATRPEDLPALETVVEANGLFAGSMLDEMTAAYFAGADCAGYWFTREDGEVPVALAYCAPERMTNGTWNLYLIAVHPEHQGRGHGRALVRHVEQTLSGRGARLLLVETSGLPAFERTRAFYRARGYTEEARIREFYNAGEDKIVFRKALAVARLG